MEKLVDSIDQIKTKLTDQEYRNIMDNMKAIHEMTFPNWESLREEQEEDGLIDQIPVCVHYRLDNVLPQDLPRVLANLVQEQALTIKQLNSVIVNQALELTTSRHKGDNRVCQYHFE